MGSLTKGGQNRRSFLQSMERVGLDYCSGDCIAVEMNVSVSHPKLVFPRTLCGNHPSFHWLCTCLCQNEERRAIE